MGNSKNKKIGEILLQNGNINLIELAMALDIQRFHKMPLGEILVQIQALDYQNLNNALNIQDDRL